jgi:hypothetical protein
VLEANLAAAYNSKNYEHEWRKEAKQKSDRFAAQFAYPEEWCAPQKLNLPVQCQQRQD